MCGGPAPPHPAPPGPQNVSYCFQSVLIPAPPDPQVALFWTKARRVVATKVALQVEARKKAVMDRHLDLIVGQTEKFSKMLAANLSAAPGGWLGSGRG